MSAKSILCVVAGLSLAVFLRGAPAQDTALPAVQQQGEVRYLSGGIGAAEVAAIKAEAARFALSLTFAKRSEGHDVFLATVPVTIHDAAGVTVLDVVSDGPYLLVDLAPGAYKITARHHEEAKTREVTLGAGAPQRVTFLWTSPDEAASPPASPPAPPPDLSAALPPLQDQGGIPYRSGGVGADESRAMKAAAAKYSLALTFATHRDGRNAYLASVPVQVLDAAGATLLDVVTDGPFLLIDLPPGRYVVVATHDGVAQRASLHVEAGRHLNRPFVWN